MPHQTEVKQVRSHTNKQLFPLEIKVTHELRAIHLGGVFALDVSRHLQPRNYSASMNNAHGACHDPTDPQPSEKYKPTICHRHPGADRLHNHLTVIHTPANHTLLLITLCGEVLQSITWVHYGALDCLTFSTGLTNFLAYMRTYRELLRIACVKKRPLDSMKQL